MNNGQIFHDLDAVNWATLQHAYGSAADVPGLLRALTSSLADVRAKARHELWGNLWHQGTIYEATARAVPFFIRLLQVDEVADKVDLLVYLAALFCGQGYWQVHKDLRSVGAPFREDLENALSGERSWQEATKLAVRAGKDAYIGLLRAGATEVRVASAYLLGLIGEGGTEIYSEILREG